MQIAVFHANFHQMNLWYGDTVFKALVYMLDLLEVLLVINAAHSKVVHT